MTNGVALAGMGPDLARPASSAGRSGQGRDGSARDGFAALVDGPKERPAQASEGAGPTQEGGPVAPDQDRRIAEEGGEECVDLLPSELQAGQILALPNNPRELALGFISGGSEAEHTQPEEALLSHSEQEPCEPSAVTATDLAAGSEAGMTGVDQLGAWLRPTAGPSEATGEVADLPTPKAGPSASRSERILDAMFRGPVKMAGLAADAVDAPVLDVPSREEPKGPGAASPLTPGLLSKDLPERPGNLTRAGLASWAAPSSFDVPTHEPLRAAGSPGPTQKGGPPSDGTPKPSADAVMKGPSAFPAIHRTETLKAPGIKPVAKDEASVTVVAETSDGGSDGKVPANGQVLPPGLVALSRPKTIGNGSIPTPGIRVRDNGRPAGTEDRISDAPPLTGWPTGTGALGSAPAHATAPEAQRIARQVATHPVLRTGGSAEVSLTPGELGHLRLIVETGDGGLRVVIEAARPETCDLMRRHVETLRQELRQEGLEAVSVSIGGGESRQGDGRASSGRQDQAWAAFAAEAATSDTGGPRPSEPPVPRPARAGGQLDLRF